MASPIFNAMGGQGNGMMQMVQRFKQFQQTFQGDPRAEVEKLIRSGRVSQQQLDQVQQMASQLQAMLGK